MRMLPHLLAGLLMLPVVLGQLSAERVFFPFDNAFTRNESAEVQAKLLKELGYDGMCTRPAKASDELLAALDQQGLKVGASFVVLPAKAAPLPENVKVHIEELKGRDTVIWLSLSDAKAKDEPAVQVLRQMHELCEANGLEMVLYPHVNFCTDTVEKCDRLIKLSKKKIGLSFTLCHFLRLNDDSKVEETLRKMAPNLKLVQICGADNTKDGREWANLIQPLGQGSFDVGRVMRTLDEIGYKGPVNLQCYMIKAPAAEQLKESMAAWRQLSKPSK